MDDPDGRSASGTPHETSFPVPTPAQLGDYAHSSQPSAQAPELKPPPPFGLASAVASPRAALPTVEQSAPPVDHEEPVALFSSAAPTPATCNMVKLSMPSKSTPDGGTAAGTAHWTARPHQLGQLVFHELHSAGPRISDTPRLGVRARTPVARRSDSCCAHAPARPQVVAVVLPRALQVFLHCPPVARFFLTDQHNRFECRSRALAKARELGLAATGDGTEGGPPHGAQPLRVEASSPSAVRRTPNARRLNLPPPTCANCALPP